MGIFDFFKGKEEDRDLDAKEMRDLILQFIKEKLQLLDGGEGKDINGIQLFIAAAQEDRFLYETAVYFSAQERLKEEIQRIADNYALGLPSEWKLEVLFTPELPASAMPAERLKTGLFFQRKKISAAGPAVGKAAIIILSGKAEQTEYLLESLRGRINIGRGKQLQAADGSFRTNTIAFPEIAGDDQNQYISRQHAHIEWDGDIAQYRLYADQGGIPPGNKTKLRSAADESLQKLNSTHIGYPLAAGDQIILGDKAVLEFVIL